jgi:hypothetical protein
VLPLKDCQELYSVLKWHCLRALLLLWSSVIFEWTILKRFFAYCYHSCFKQDCFRIWNIWLFMSQLLSIFTYSWHKSYVAKSIALQMGCLIELEIIFPRRFLLLNVRHTELYLKWNRRFWWALRVWILFRMNRLLIKLIRFDLSSGAKPIRITGSSWKKQSPTFFWYCTDRIKN